jgi:hypothetical protein
VRRASAPRSAPIRRVAGRGRHRTIPKIFPLTRVFAASDKAMAKVGNV